LVKRTTGTTKKNQRLEKEFLQVESFCGKRLDTENLSSGGGKGFPARTCGTVSIGNGDAVA
jgi:hypothetical protein